MDQTSTVILIIAIIIILGSIAYTIQSIEEKKRARKLLVMSLKSQIRHALNIYNSLPEVFMTPELHEFLRKFLLVKWNKLLPLDSSEETRRSHAAFKERANNRVITLQHPQGSMTVYQETGQVHHALGQLKEISKWLADLSKTNQITESTFNELGWQTKDFYDRVSCDIEIFEAIETEKAHGPGPAIHKYHSVLKSLENLNQSEALDSQVYEVHKKVEYLNNKLMIINEQREAEMAAQAERDAEAARNRPRSE